MTVQSISAITLAVRDMARSVAFYHDGAGIPILYGGPDASFTSLSVGDGYLNLILSDDAEVRWWGRCILYVDDVDAHHQPNGRGRLQPRWCSLRRPLAGALLPHHRPRRPRDQLCAANHVLKSPDPVRVAKADFSRA